MHHGLPRKIRIAFVVQMALASLAILLAFYVVTTLFKYSFIQATLKDEARHYWELHQASPVQPPPRDAASSTPSAGPSSSRSSSPPSAPRIRSFKSPAMRLLK